MAEQLIINSINKEEKYKELIPQIKCLLEGEDDIIANMANIAAAVREVFGFFWVGFYRVKNNVLILGPFQGPIACMRIRKGKGVCGSAWAEAETLVVPDVDAFPGHIACSSASRSEIVIPIIKDGEVIAVFDVDSDELNTFDEVDKLYMEQLCSLL